MREWVVLLVKFGEMGGVDSYAGADSANGRQQMQWWLLAPGTRMAVK